MADQTIDELLEDWEYEIDGVPKHWEKTPERKAVDSKYIAKLKSLIETMCIELIGENELSASVPLGMPDSLYNHKEGKDSLRREQRQRIPQVIAKYFNTGEKE